MNKSLSQRLADWPFGSDLGTFFNSFDVPIRVFNDIGLPVNIPGVFSTSGVTYDTNETEVILSFDVPGVPKKHVEATYDDGIVTIKAEQDSRKYSYQVSVPENADTKTVQHKLENGVLTLTFARVGDDETAPVDLLK